MEEACRRQEGGRLPERGIEGLALGQGKGLALGLRMRWWKERLMLAGAWVVVWRMRLGVDECGWR
jgi:hypothetical protein